MFPTLSIATVASGSSRARRKIGDRQLQLLLFSHDPPPGGLAALSRRFSRRGQSPFGVSAPPERADEEANVTKAIKRSEIIHLRLTEEERARFSAVFAPDDAPISEAVRRLMREAAGLGPTFDGDVADKIGALTDQLKAIAIDINQAVRAINVGKAPELAAIRTTFEEFAEALWEVESFYRSLCTTARERRRSVASAS